MYMLFLFSSGFLKTNVITCFLKKYCLWAKNLRIAAHKQLVL